MTGRTVTRWVRFGIHDSTGVSREIPISSLTPVGFDYPEEDVSAWQDAVIGFLTQQPTASIEISGPFSTNAASSTFAASAQAPVLSGSYTVLKPISAPTFTSPLALAIHIGIQGYWTDGQPVFGVIAATTAAGYICTQFVGDGLTYTAKFQPFPGTTPAWGTSIITG